MDESALSSLLQRAVARLPLLGFLGLILIMMRKGNAFDRKYGRTLAEFMQSDAELIAANRDMAKPLVEIRPLLQTGKS